MSQFPTQLDSDIDLPRVDDNITEIGADAINALRDAMFNVESNIGIGAQGTTGSIAQRLSVSINPDGTISPSLIIGLLSTVQITDAQVSPTASINEAKLNLTYSTSSLYNLYITLKTSVDILNGFLSLTGVKLEPHIDGTNYNHLLSHIHVDAAPSFVKNLQISTPSPGTNIINRNATNLETLLQDVNSDLVVHEKLDSSSGVSVNSGGTIPPTNFAHVAAGVYVDPSAFSSIPQNNNSVQDVLDYIDNSSLLLLGSRIQNFYSNGISRTSRSSSLVADGYGAPIIPPTPVTAYLLNNPPGPTSSIPVDDFSHGDDVIVFNPTSTQLSTFNFDAQFAQIEAGDILTINYGTGISLQFVIDSTKNVINGSTRSYAVRINGKNPFSNANAIARVDKSTFSRGKYGVLASSRAINFTNDYESIIVSNPRSAVVLGNDFDASMFDAQHYNLYLSILINGTISGLITLPAIDITGNQGATPGQYTLDNIIDATNAAFRAPGFNYRFVAFKYAGQFGLMLADPYNNTSFSITSGNVDGYGNYTSTSLSAYPNNAIDNFNQIDPLGFGLSGSNVASPPTSASYPSAQSAFNSPTLYFYPLKRNFYYTNGVEKERLNSDPLTINNIADSFGDGYWPATILPAPATSVLPFRVEVSYQIALDLSTSGLKNGKTIVVQPAFPITDPRYNFRDYGRFTIKNVSFSGCSADGYTTITVYDGVHGAGVSPAATSTNIPVSIYFSDDSVSFDAESVFDSTASGPYKRFYENYVDGNGHTFTHERARFINSITDISNINLFNVSPKLRGYSLNNGKQIRFNINNYDQTTGVYDGYLSRWNPSSSTSSNFGPDIVGKKGEVIRFYDETNIDYIDFIFDINSTISSFSSRTIDIQLFDTLELNREIMLVSTCQVDDVSKKISYLQDARQFGNVSEEELSTSALNFISAPEKLFHFNGVARGFDVSGIVNGDISLLGGTVLVNGKIENINNQIITIPPVKETLSSVQYSVNWALCANSDNDLIIIPLTDYDPVLGTPNIPNRLFTAFNAVSSNTYSLDSCSFSFLLNNRKDLTALYIISSTVSGSGSSATVSLTSRDVRRFANDADASISAVLTGDNSQGNFKTFYSAVNWLRFNNTFQNTLQIKGTSTLSTDPGLNFPLNVVGAGNGTSLIFNNSSSIANVNFNNCSLVFNSSVNLINVNFNNCTISIANTITLSQTNVVNSTVNVSITEGFALGSQVSFINSTFNYTANPIGIGSYNTGDLANVSSGLMYANITTGLTDLKVKDCVFNNTLSDHFPFISIQLSSYSAVLQNVNISNNKFNSQAALNDIRAVVTFTSTLVASAGAGVYPKFPKLVNVFIENNICSHDQMLLLSTMRNDGSPIVGALLATTNCRITGNTCGTIGFITAADGVSYLDNAAVANGGFIRNKEDRLLIENNICRFISNLDYKGRYIPFRAITFPTPITDTEWVQVSTGAYIVNQNSANWILLGSSHYTVNNEGGIISANKLSPSSTNTYLSNFIDTENSGITPPNVGILLRRENLNSLADDTNNIIDRNILCQKQALHTDGTYDSPLPYYDAGIVCLNSCHIINNICDSVINNSSNPIVFLGSIGTMMIRGNNLRRNGLSTNAYIGTVSPVSSATNSVIITDNIFDSAFTDTANTIITTSNNFPPTWTICSNKNQTETIAISLVDYMMSPAINASGSSSPSSTGPAQPYLSTTDGSNYRVSSLRQNLIGNLGAGTNYVEFFDLVGSSIATRNYTFAIPLDYIIPNNVQIISANIGSFARSQDGGSLDVTGTANQLTLSLVSYKNTVTANVLDVKNNTNVVSIGGTLFNLDTTPNIIDQFTLIIAGSASSGSNYNIVTSTTLQSATQYCPVVPSSSTGLITEKNTRICLEVDLNYLRAAGSGTVYWILSPIVLQYKW